MGRIYVGQSSLRLNFSTGADLTNNTTTVINVTYPQGSTSTWTCTVSDASTGAIFYSMASGSILKTAGMYLLQPQVTFTDSTTAYGETVKLQVYPLYN